MLIKQISSNNEIVICRKALISKILMYEKRTNEDTKIRSLGGTYCDINNLKNRILEYHFFGEE
jgi:hypothetical protein